MNEIQISQAESLEVINRSEIDMQISTAKKYPRNVEAALNEIKEIAGRDPETAADCFYALKRQDKSIEGLSVRMAEIIADCWGNLRIASRVIANDGKIITAQAVCMDLEKNVAVSTETQRRITDKNGRTFSEDMQVVTGNAASSIAFRNAVLKIVPRAITKRVVDEVQQLAKGLALDLDTMRERTISWYAKKGVAEVDLLEYMQVDCREALNQDMLMMLRGLCNAINEGSTTVEESIAAVLRTRRAEAAAAKKAETNKEKVAASMAKK